MDRRSDRRGGARRRAVPPCLSRKRCPAVTGYPQCGPRAAAGCPLDRERAHRDSGVCSRCSGAGNRVEMVARERAGHLPLHPPQGRVCRRGRIRQPLLPRAGCEGLAHRAPLGGLRRRQRGDRGQHGPARLARLAQPLAREGAERGAPGREALGEGAPAQPQRLAQAYVPPATRVAAASASGRRATTRRGGPEPAPPPGRRPGSAEVEQGGEGLERLRPGDHVVVAEQADRDAVDSQHVGCSWACATRAAGPGRSPGHSV